MHLSCLNVAAQVLLPSSLCRSLVCSGSQSCGVLNTRTQPCCQTPLLLHSHFFSSDPSFSLCCHLSSAMFTTRSQAIKPPPYLSFTSLLPVNPFTRPSINPSLHHTANINPRPTSFAYSFFFFFFCPQLSIHHSPLHSSVHTSLWFDFSKNISLRADTWLFSPPSLNPSSSPPIISHRTQISSSTPSLSF